MVTSSGAVGFENEVVGDQHADGKAGPDPRMRVSQANGAARVQSTRANGEKSDPTKRS
jgi:hypothetical protein